MRTVVRGKQLPVILLVGTTIVVLLVLYITSLGHIKPCNSADCLSDTAWRIYSAQVKSVGISASKNDIVKDCYKSSVFYADDYGKSICEVKVGRSLPVNGTEDSLNKIKAIARKANFQGFTKQVELTELSKGSGRYSGHNGNCQLDTIYQTGGWSYNLRCFVYVNKLPVPGYQLIQDPFYG